MKSLFEICQCGFEDDVAAGLYRRKRGFDLFVDFDANVLKALSIGAADISCCDLQYPAVRQLKRSGHENISKRILPIQQRAFVRAEGAGTYLRCAGAERAQQDYQGPIEHT